VGGVTPDELNVYDNYVEWFTHLANLCAAAQALPLEAMLAANERITLVGAMIGPERSEKVTPEMMARQRELIEKVIAFRDSLVV
jgi:hypothetical protein